MLDSDIPADTGVKIGTPFSDLYSKAFGNCQKADGDDNRAVECKAEGSQHISYQFSGNGVVLKVNAFGRYPEKLESQ